jgi:hypothetical protein
MHFKALLLALGLLPAIPAHADSPPTPQPLAPSALAKNSSATKGAPRRMTPPAISVTRVTRRADGSLGIDCVQRPNPKLRAHEVQP